jgi:hypothetical protein
MLMSLAVPLMLLSTTVQLSNIDAGAGGISLTANDKHSNDKHSNDKHADNNLTNQSDNNPANQSDSNPTNQPDNDPPNPVFLFVYYCLGDDCLSFCLLLSWG